MAGYIAPIKVSRITIYGSIIPAINPPISSSEAILAARIPKGLTRSSRNPRRDNSAATTLSRYSFNTFNTLLLAMSDSISDSSENIVTSGISPSPWKNACSCSSKPSGILTIVRNVLSLSISFALSSSINASTTWNCSSSRKNRTNSGEFSWPNMRMGFDRFSILSICPPIIYPTPPINNGKSKIGTRIMLIRVLRSRRTSLSSLR